VLLAGSLAGLLSGGLAAWLLVSDPGRGRGGPGTLRGDIDVLQAHVTAVDTRLAVAEAGWQSAAEKWASVAAQGNAPPVAVEHLRAVSEDLRALRDAVKSELQHVEARLADLRRRVDDMGTSPAASGAAAQGPPSQEDEDKWATLARDSDAGVRFSALSRLGRARTERSVQVSVERLGDDDDEVVWQAIRNLGQFRERDAAGEVAPFLDHEDVVLRAAANEALVLMGAPRDTGFEATDAPAKRKAAAEALRRWAESH
jgi:HEAT repeat protein